MLVKGVPVVLAMCEILYIYIKDMNQIIHRVDLYISVEKSSELVTTDKNLN